MMRKRTLLRYALLLTGCFALMGASCPWDDDYDCPFRDNDNDDDERERRTTLMINEPVAQVQFHVTNGG